MTEKRCWDCGESKALDEFYAHKRNADGRGSFCKPCQQARAAQQRERKRAGGAPDPRQPRRSATTGRAEKVCSGCREVKPLEDFVRNRARADGRGTRCRPCHNLRGRADRERLHGSSQHYHLRRRYGIGADEVAAMVEAQGGVCAVCREGKAEHVDHDHVTGLVRGVLCFTCNGGLGQFRDRADVMERAIDYLRGTTWQRTRICPGVYRLHSPRSATAASSTSSPAPRPTSSPGGGSPSPRE